MEPILSVEKLEKHFGGLVAVHSLSFNLQPGEVLGLMGPNGAGKSTAFNLISGEHRPDNGRILYNGVDITGLPTYKICRMGIARTYQIPQPFTKMSAVQNLMVAARFGKGLKLEHAKEEAIKLLELVGLSAKKDVLAQDLSIPSLKKLELGRALATNPKLLLLDEVAAGATESEIPLFLSLLDKIREMGKTIIIVEHVLKVLIEAVDRIIVMDKGEKITEGLHGEILEDKKVIEVYFGEFLEE